MAESTAQVKLSLKDSGFYREFENIKGKVVRSGKDLGRQLRASLDDGIRGGMDALKGLGSRIKDVGGLVAGIAGVGGFASLVHGAIEADQKFRQLAFTIGAGRGLIEDHSRIQRRAEKIALDWATSAGEVADAWDTVFNTVGDADFSERVLSDIAMAAKASGQEMSTIAGLVAEMNRQFGLSREEIPGALAEILSLGARGGLSIQDLGANLGKLGRTAKVAGLEGSDGLTKLVGMANQISAAAGDAGGSVEKLQALMNLFAQDERMKKFGIEIEGLDAVQLLEQVLAKSGGDASKMAQMIGENAVTVASAWGERFAKVMDETSGTAEDKTRAALEDFRNNLEEASTGAMSAKELRERAEKNLSSTASKIAQTLETMQQSFTKMTPSIEKLAQSLPDLAQAVASVITWISENPVTAGALAGAGVFGRGFLGGMANSLMQGSAAGGAVGGGVGGAAAGAPAVGNAIGNSALESMKGGAGGIGKAIGAAFAAAPAIALAGSAIAAAIEQALILARELDKAGRHEEGMARDEIRNATAIGAIPQRNKARFTTAGGARFGDTGEVEYLDMDEFGNITTRDTPFAKTGDSQMTSFLRQKLFESGDPGQKMLSGVTGVAPVPQVSFDANGRMIIGGPQGPPGSAKKDEKKDNETAAATRETAKHMATVARTVGRPMDFRVVNPEEIANAINKGGGTRRGWFGF